MVHGTYHSKTRVWKNDAVRDKNFTAMLSGHHVWLLMYRRGFTQAPAGSQIAEHHLFSIWTI